MNNEPFDVEGLPDAGGLNIDYRETIRFEPTEEQLEMLQADFEVISEKVRTHLTNEFTVTPRLTRTQDGLQGHVIVEFPSGDAIGPGIPITADMFDGVSEPDWNGPIPPDKIEEMSRDITMAAVTQWATMVEHAGGTQDIPAS